MANALQKIMIAASFTGLAACTNNVDSKDAVCRLTTDGGAEIVDAQNGQVLIEMDLDTIVQSDENVFYGTSVRKEDGMREPLTVDKKRGECLTGTNPETGWTYKLEI